MLLELDAPDTVIVLPISSVKNSAFLSAFAVVIFEVVLNNPIVFTAFDTVLLSNAELLTVASVSLSILFDIAHNEILSLSNTGESVL